MLGHCELFGNLEVFRVEVLTLSHLVPQVFIMHL